MLSGVLLGALSPIAQERSESPPVSSKGSLPAPSTDGDFSRAAQSIVPAVSSTGHQKWSTGTAVYVDAKARLLATAAPAADTRLLCKELYVVRSGTTFPGIGKEGCYRVARVWYHKLTPRVNRDNFVSPLVPSSPHLRVARCGCSFVVVSLRRASAMKESLGQS